MGDCLQADKPSRYDTRHSVYDTSQLTLVNIYSKQQSFFINIL